MRLGAAITGSLAAGVLLFAHAALASDLGRLDRLVAANDTLGVLRAFREAGWAEQELLAWLARRAEAGYVPAQYELALRVSRTQPTQALDWFARGSVGRVLDESECRHKGRATFVGMLFDLGYQSLNALVRANETTFLASMERALTSEAASLRVKQYWICDAGNANPTEVVLLPPEEREAKRKAQLDDVVRQKDQRALEARVNSQANPHGYPLRTISRALVVSDMASPGERMYWMDNDTLLFGAYRVVDEGRGKRPSLYLWKHSARELKVLAPGFSRLCFDSGIVSYYTSRDGVAYYREGLAGGEAEKELGKWHPNKEVLRVRCRAVAREDYPYSKYQRPLVAGGVLEIPTEQLGAGHPYRFYPEGKTEPVTLPFAPLYAGLHHARYSPYAKAYVFVSTIERPHTGALPVWTLFVDGSWAVFDVPRGPWSRGSIIPQPTAKGWLIGTPLNGVYLIRGDQIVKLSRGQVKDLAVSADGCRAALAMRLDEDVQIRPYPIQILDLCAQGD